MSKKMLAFYIVLSIISLIWIVLAYFGVTRLCQLKLKSCEKYAKSYVTLPRVDTKNKVIVSLYTEEKDLNDIKMCINSLLDQTVHPDQIILNISEHGDIVIPEYIKNNKIIVTHKLSEKYGECSAFISPLIREKNGDAIIIVVCDKTSYGLDFIESMVEESEKDPSKIVYVKGYTAKEFLLNGSTTDQHNRNDIIDVCYGILFKPLFFMEDVIAFENIPVHIKKCINIFVSYHINKLKLKKVQLDYSEIFNFNTSKKDVRDDKLCIEYYSAYFPTID